MCYFFYKGLHLIILVSFLGPSSSSDHEADRGTDECVEVTLTFDSDYIFLLSPG